MAVTVTIHGARRVPSETRDLLMLDVTVGTSHQLIPFDEEQLLGVGNAQAQIDYIARQAVAVAQSPIITTLPTGVLEIRSATTEIGGVPMAGFGVAQRTAVVDTAFTTNDYAVWFDATSGNRVGTLPTAVGNGGQRYEAKKQDASAHTVTLTPSGAEKIDGASSLVLSVPGQAVTLTSDNSGWQIS